MGAPRFRSEGRLSQMTESASVPANWQELDKVYRESRRLWAIETKRPYSRDIDTPDPGELPIIDSEEG